LLSALLLLLAPVLLLGARLLLLALVRLLGPRLPLLALVRLLGPRLLLLVSVRLLDATLFLVLLLFIPIRLPLFRLALLNLFWRLSLLVLVLLCVRGTYGSEKK